MISLNNGYSSMFFSCHLEIIDFLGEKEFNTVIAGDHSQYNITYVNIT